MTTAAAPAKTPQPRDTRAVIQLDFKAASLLSLVLSCASFFGGWYVKDAKAESANTVQVESITKKIDEHQRKLDAMRPASEMVSKDQFNEYQAWVRETLTEIKGDIKDVKRNTARGK